MLVLCKLRVDPLTLDLCGAQVAATHLDHISEPERRTQVRRGTRAFSSSSLGPAVQHQGLDLLKVWVGATSWRTSSARWALAAPPRC